VQKGAFIKRRQISNRDRRGGNRFRKEWVYMKLRICDGSLLQSEKPRLAARKYSASKKD